MADFTKAHKKNVRYSVNRSMQVYLTLSDFEVSTWKKLVSVLKERRNTGNQIETFLYLLRKYEPKIKQAKSPKTNSSGTVQRLSQLKFRMSKKEFELWDRLSQIYNHSKVEFFMHLVDREYLFQDEIEIIKEN